MLSFFFFEKKRIPCIQYTKPWMMAFNFIALKKIKARPRDIIHEKNKRK